jgi:RHS repeat-associated protein
MAGSLNNTFDGRGNLVRRVDSGGTAEFVYDARNLLVEIKRNGATIGKYGYDPSGLRVRIEDTEGVRLLLVEPTQQIEIAEYSDAGLLLRRFTHNPTRVDELLSQKDTAAPGSPKYYALADALGSVTGLVDADGVVKMTRHYDAYGATTSSSGSASTPFLYTGRRLDAALVGVGAFGGDLYYYRARWYDPAIGRFISADPEGDVDGPNLYGYVRGRPTIWQDPGGLEACAPLPNMSQIRIDAIAQLHDLSSSGKSFQFAEEGPGSILGIQLPFFAIPNKRRFEYGKFPWWFALGAPIVGMCENTMKNLVGESTFMTMREIKEGGGWTHAVLVACDKEGIAARGWKHGVGDVLAHEFTHYILAKLDMTDESTRLGATGTKQKSTSAVWYSTPWASALRSTLTGLAPNYTQLYTHGTYNDTKSLSLRRWDQ